jgi:hypothetical protein
LQEASTIQQEHAVQTNYARLEYLALTVVFFDMLLQLAGVEVANWEGTF